jgi:hypothetical protein
MSSEESEEPSEGDAIDVFPDTFDFLERKIGYILRFSFMLELSVDQVITAYLTSEPRSVDMLRGGILPYLALDVRVKLVKEILDTLGRSQEFPTLMQDIRAMFTLRNTLAHSTLIHHVKPENKVGDIPFFTWTRGGSKFLVLRKEEVLKTYEAGQRASSELSRLSNDIRPPSPDQS